jgi:hypothetical protein
VHREFRLEQEERLAVLAAHLRQVLVLLEEVDRHGTEVALAQEAEVSSFWDERKLM